MYEIHRAQANTVKLCTENTKKSQIIPGYGFGFVRHIDSFSRLSDFQRFYFLGKKVFKSFTQQKSQKKKLKYEDTKATMSMTFDLYSETIFCV